jgi:hypothetical protein
MRSVHISNNFVSSNIARGKDYAIQHNVIKFVSEFRQVGGFLRVLTSSNKTDRHNLTEILLNVALNIIYLPYMYACRNTNKAKYALSRLNSKSIYTITKMNDNIHADSKIAGSRNARS